MPEVLINLAAGRSEELKKNLMKDISDVVVKHTGLDAEHVVVTIMEVPLVNKMKGGKTFVERAAAPPK